MQCLKCAGVTLFESETCSDETTIEEIEFIRCVNCGERVYQIKERGYEIIIIIEERRRYVK